jgi:hypothetical protein
MGHGGTRYEANGGHKCLCYVVPDVKWYTDWFCMSVYNINNNSSKNKHNNNDDDNNHDNKYQVLKGANLFTFLELFNNLKI